MKKVRFSYVRWLILTILFCFVLFASISSEIGERYALFLYPGISKIISLVSSMIPFSLDEWSVLAFIFLLIGYPFYARIRIKRKWFHVLLGEIEILLWIYVWFYWGWGMNYYRESFYQRADLSPVVYDEIQFKEFLQDFTARLNQTYQECSHEGWVQSPDLFRPLREITNGVYPVHDIQKENTIPRDSESLCQPRVPYISNASEKDKVSFDAHEIVADVFLSDSSRYSMMDLNLNHGIHPYTMEFIHDEIKAIYQKVPPKYGLTTPTSYQYPKNSSFNSLYSNVGVLGFMGPFFAESHVNHELSALEYPFTYAHELSHLLGISSEAEANLWAYSVCLKSSHPLVRLSGYFGLLSCVRSNAMSLLQPSDFENWEKSLSPDISAVFYRIHVYWALRYNHLLGEIQSTMYTFYLKRNKISSGQKNYAQVVGMLLALPNYKLEFSE